MRKRLWVYFFAGVLWLTSFRAIASLNSEWIGEWHLVAMIYQGKDLPLPNPELNLRWTFFSNGTERLYWDRGTADFCERFGHFEILENGILKETSFALNPKNAADCAKDPDMQTGKVTQTRFQFRARDLWLYFGLGDEELIYVLRRVP